MKGDILNEHRHVQTDIMTKNISMAQISNPYQWQVFFGQGLNCSEAFVTVLYTLYVLYYLLLPLF